MRRMRRGSGAFEAPGSPIEEDEMSRKRSPTGCREGCAAPSLRGTNQGLPGARFLRQGPTLLDHDEIVHLHDLRPVANAVASPELRVQQAKERNERPALARRLVPRIRGANVLRAGWRPCTALRANLCDHPRASPRDTSSPAPRRSTPQLPSRGHTGKSGYAPKLTL